MSGKIFIELSSRLGGVAGVALLVVQKIQVPRRNISILSPHEPVWSFVSIDNIAYEGNLIERGITSSFSIGYYSDDASVGNRLINTGIDKSLQVSSRARYEDYQPDL